MYISTLSSDTVKDIKRANKYVQHLWKTHSFATLFFQIFLTALSKDFLLYNDFRYLFLRLSSHLCSLEEGGYVSHTQNSAGHTLRIERF